jgi:hypothetical protein
MGYPRGKKDKNEHFPTNISVGDKDCMGCQRWEMDIMISHSDGDGNTHDVFLTKKQATKLALTLLDRLGEDVVRNYKLNNILK